GPGDRPYIGLPVATCRATHLSSFPESLFTGSAIGNVPAGLPTRTNDLHIWGARATLRFEPDLDASWVDTSWLLGAQYLRRDEHSRLGHAYGTSALELGTADVLGYIKPSVAEMQARKFLALAAT